MSYEDYSRSSLVGVDKELENNVGKGNWGFVTS